MATKKTTKKSSKKSNVSKSTQLTQFKFQWWMAVAGIGVIALIGIVVVRFSQAYGMNDCTYGLCTSGIVRGNNGYGGITIEEYSAGRSTGLHYYQLSGSTHGGFYDASRDGSCHGIQPAGYKPDARLTNNSTVNVVNGCG